MSDLESPPRSPRDQLAVELAARACDVLDQLLPADVARELRAVVADQLALHPDLARVVERAVVRPTRAESGDEVLGEAAPDDGSGASTGATPPASALDGRGRRR